MSALFTTILPSATKLTGIAERRLSRRAHGFGAAAAVVGLGAANAVLTRLYQASGHPVSYAEGQTSFSGSSIKGWYATMQQAGTLDTYVATQLFDYVFILMVFATGALAATFLARITGSTKARGAARWAAAFIGFGAALDAVENLISFAMLANPQGFADWIAVPYSAAAAAKFALLTLGMGLLLLSLIATGLHVLTNASARGERTLAA